MDNTPFKVTEYDLDKKTSSISTLATMMAANANSHKIYWCHCDTSQTDSWLPGAKELQLSDAVIEMIKDKSTLPELEEADDALSIKIQAPLKIQSDTKLKTEYVSIVIHLSAYYCVTFTNKSIVALDEFAHQSEKSLRYAKTPGFMLFLILDDILNDYAKILLELEAFSDELESTLRLSNKNHYRIVMRIKREAVRSKRYLSAIRDILMRTSGRKINAVSESCRKSLVDLFNHSQALISESDSVREISNSMLDMIDNAIMQKMSKTMKVLTAYATIFMPPTLISGIYGMNFHYMPELDWRYGYLMALGLIFSSGFVLYLIFRKLKWF